MKSDTLLTIAAIAGGGYILYNATKGIQKASTGIGEGVSNAAIGTGEGVSSALRGVGSSIGEISQGASSLFQFLDEYLQRQTDIQNFNRQFDIESGYSAMLRKTQQQYELEREKYSQIGDTEQQRQESAREAEAAGFFSEVQTGLFKGLRNASNTVSTIVNLSPPAIMLNTAQKTYDYLMGKINTSKTNPKNTIEVKATADDVFYASKTATENAKQLRKQYEDVSKSPSLSLKTKSLTSTKSTSSIRNKINSILGR